MPLANLISDTAHAVVEAFGLEQKDGVVEGLATRWQRGTLVTVATGARSGRHKCVNPKRRHGR